MKTYTNEDLTAYLENDWIMEMIKSNILENEKGIRTNQWLMEMDNKRMVYADVYGDMLVSKMQEKTCLDIGGGINSLTKVLASNTQYTLLDFLAHGGNDILNSIVNKYKMNCISEDWFYYFNKTDDVYDIVIANDIFPDVDQRMELFLDMILPRCSELRLVVTYYNNPKFYITKRIDDTEILTFLSWDGEITAMKLRKFQKSADVNEDELNEMSSNFSSIYRNGRQVSYIKFKGEL